MIIFKLIIRIILQTRRYLGWILGVSFMFYVYTQKNVVVEVTVNKQEIINDKTLEDASHDISINKENIYSDLNLFVHSVF